MSPEIKVQAKIVEPGWVVVHYDGPRPLPYEQYHWLDRALHDWLKQFPKYILRRVTPIENDGQVVGLNAWYSVVPGPKEMPRFDIDEKVLAAHPKEYLEAVMADVANFMLFGTFRQKYEAVVNRRGIAAVISQSPKRGLIVPQERLATWLREDQHQELADWLANPRTTLFILAMPEDFEPPFAPE